MGNVFSVQVSSNQIAENLSNFVCGKANYLHKLEENVEVFKNLVQELKDLRSDVMRRVEMAENNQLKRLDVVQGWLLRAEALESQADKLLNASSQEIERLCVCGFCSKNLLSSYRYGEHVVKKLREAEVLKSNGEFQVVAERVPATKVDERPIQTTVGMQPMLANAWKHLMEDGVGILGLYGMGGVGKTALLTHINNKFCEARNEFDYVIWVVVNKELRIGKIQDDIGKKLGLYNGEWTQKSQSEKAVDIFHVLRRKKFVLLLDDIWKKVILEDIGVPSPSKENGCKVAFTTRSREICRHLQAEVEMEIKCLAADVAWDLFQKKVGGDTLNSHPCIRRLARKVAEICSGLPLALNVIGEAMACKRTEQEWHHAIHVLKLSISEFPGLKNEILPIVKFSYDNLKEDKVKSCFLYCALFPKGYEIKKDWLIDYWISEGFLDGNKGRYEAEYEGYEIIGTLLSACLLIEGKLEYSVKMHDVVRQMALWIASDFGKQKENFIVKTGAQLQEIPKVEDWRAVKRMSLMNNHIKDISCSPNCSQLQTLILKKNYLVNISGEFLSSMPKLEVLDLSCNPNLATLPAEVSKLVSLQVLFLNYTGIEGLPVGLEELRKLINLDLSHTRKLQSISGISRFRNLQILRLFRSGLHLSPSLMKELQLLEHLNLLTVTLKDSSSLQRFLSIRKLASCTRHLCLKEYKSKLDITSLATLSRLGYYRMESSDIPEIKINWGSKRNKKISSQYFRKTPSNPCFFHLFKVRIHDCRGLRDLTWLLFAPNLAYLIVERSSQIREIISREKAISVTNKEPNVTPFEALKQLKLMHLDELKSIYWSPLPFSHLIEIDVIKCPHLRKLPLNSESARGRNVFIHAEKEWKQGLEWEDEATKERFFYS